MGLSLSSITSGITALSNLLLVSPQSTVGYQPQTTTSGILAGLQKPPSLVFHYEGEQTVSLESDITDHFVEDNTALQDQIALRPETITTNGFIGELNDIVTDINVNGIGGLGNIPGIPGTNLGITSIPSKLTTIAAYTPGLSATALIAYNQAVFLARTAANAANAAISSITTISGGGGETVINGTGVVTNPPNQNKQQIAFQQFYGYWRNRTLFTVQTPWAVFENMAIKSLKAVQDAETRVITDFEVTFKLIRFATTITSTGILDITNFSNRAANQVRASNPTQLGTSTPMNASESFLSQVSSTA